jgi:pimeloyl-ACP methyl ester carboxylesterase
MLQVLELRAILKRPRIRGEEMSTFVLIHGGWHGAWCWERVSHLLENAGHRVIAPDLPAHGGNPIPQSAPPYELYVPKVCEVLDQQSELAILVGHSSGGMIITEAAEKRPDCVKVLVYLSAFLLPPNSTPRDVMLADAESILQSCIVVDMDKRLSAVKPECAKQVFYLDCTDEDAAWAISHLQPEPLIPSGLSTAHTPMNVREAIAYIPRVYIECLHDKALGPATQKRMYTDLPCQKVYSLSTSHSPFLSAPRQLVNCLLDIDATFPSSNCG